MESSWAYSNWKTKLRTHFHQYVNTLFIETKQPTIESPIPRLKIPAKGARGRSLKPEDIQMGSAQPSKSEKWLVKLKELIIFYKKTNPHHFAISEKNGIPDYKKIRVTVVCKSIHKLVNELSQRPNSPYLPNQVKNERGTIIILFKHIKQLRPSLQQ